MAENQEQNKGIEVFLSYSHKDEDFRKKLEDHLSGVINSGQISTWNYKKIDAGEEWDDAIKEHLDSAQIILLLISSDFLASEYCNSTEMKRAMQRHDLGEACVIPILLRYVDWKDASFAKLQILPSNARPITSKNWSDPDLAFFDVVQGIKKIIEKINSGHLKSVSEPFTLVVDQMERGDFVTITAAISNANPGAKILVRQGVYDEDLIIDKPLDITGDGDLGDVVIRAVEKDAVLFKTIRGRISNLMIKQYKSNNFSGINILQGNLDVEDCDISSDNSSCITIHGGAYPRIKNNKIHGSNNNGVLIFDNGQGVIESNNIYGNSLSGVSVEGDSNPTIISNKIHDNGNGILIDNSKGLINSNDIFNNNKMGIRIVSGSKPNLISNQIQRNKLSGICIYKSQGLLRHNDISNNIDSGVVIYKSDPALTKNEIYNNNRNISATAYDESKDEEQLQIEESKSAIGDLDIVENSESTTENLDLSENSESSTENSDPIGMSENTIEQMEQKRMSFSKRLRMIKEDLTDRMEDITTKLFPEEADSREEELLIYSSNDKDSSDEELEIHGNDFMLHDPVQKLSNAGVLIHSGNPTIYQNNINKNHGYGIFVLSGEGIIEDNELLNNKLGSCYISELATFKVDRNKGIPAKNLDIEELDISG